MVAEYDLITIGEIWPALSLPTYLSRTACVGAERETTFSGKVRASKYIAGAWLKRASSKLTGFC
jgi:hypothetical protein